MRLITALAVVLFGLSMAGCPKEAEEAKPAPAAEAVVEESPTAEAPAEDPGKSGEEHGKSGEDHGKPE